MKNYIVTVVMRTQRSYFQYVNKVTAPDQEIAKAIMIAGIMIAEAKGKKRYFQLVEAEAEEEA